MATRYCHICGCTETFGCEEGCWFIDPRAFIEVRGLLGIGAEVDVCSVCAGITPMHTRHYTLTAAGAPNAPIPDNMLGIFTPLGVLVGLAWEIAEAQGLARGLDLFWGQSQHEAEDHAFGVGSSKAAFRDFLRRYQQWHKLAAAPTPAPEPKPGHVGVRVAIEFDRPLNDDEGAAVINTILAAAGVVVEQARERGEALALTTDQQGEAWMLTLVPAGGAPAGS